MAVATHRVGDVLTVVLNRPEARNAVDRPTADALAEAFRDFEASDAKVAVLYGDAGVFCAGADLKAVASGGDTVNRLDEDVVGVDGPMGPTRMRLSKPVIAAIEGHAVAGGLELACWCDMRVAAEDATLGVFCRRWGVPFIDGGTFRLPRLVGMSHAMDLILTGRGVDAAEAHSMGLVNRVVPPGQARAAAEALAAEISRFPQLCLKHDRMAAYEGFGMPEADALANEFQHGLISLSDAAAGVVFDLGGVVFDSPIVAIMEYEKELGLPHAAINRLIAGMGNQGAFQRMERGELTVDEFVGPFEHECREAGLVGVDGASFMERVLDHIKPRPLMLECMSALKENGFAVGILTNNFKDGGKSDGMVEYLSSLADVVVESAKVGLRKPDPRIYQLVCDELKLPPKQLVYLDDIGYNLKPAKAMGMTTIKVALDDTTGAAALRRLQSIVGVPLLRTLSKGRL